MFSILSNKWYGNKFRFNQLGGLVWVVEYRELQEGFHGVNSIFCLCNILVKLTKSNKWYGKQIHIQPGKEFLSNYTCHHELWKFCTLKNQLRQKWWCWKGYLNVRNTAFQDMHGWLRKHYLQPIWYLQICLKKIDATSTCDPYNQVIEDLIHKQCII